VRERECCFHEVDVSFESVCVVSKVRSRARRRHRPASRFGVVPEDDLRVVREDDDERSPVGYRSDVRTLLPLARRYVFDVLALAVVVITQIDVWTQVEDNRTRVAVIALLTAGALLFRRRARFVSVLAVAAGAVAFSLLDAAAAYDTDTMFLVLILATWAAGSLSEPRQAGTAFAAILAAGWVVFLRAPGVPGTEVVWLTFPLTIFFVISVATARSGEQVRLAEERAQRSEDEARRAVEDERSRITRELHDVLAHSVSVMTVQASAVRRLLKPEQEREREALLTVEETGRQALAEMRRMLGIMRSDHEAAALAPQPGLGTLPELVEQVRQSGLPVELSVEGRPVTLPAGVDLSAYRIVQEALTNALKHAGPAHAWVFVRYADGDVQIDVENDGRNDGDGDGAGHGLVGMRERVALCGGELHSGPRPGGGFRISARLPVAGSTA
jgi:signal transduction histidine kinase